VGSLSRFPRMGPLQPDECRQGSALDGIEVVPRKAPFVLEMKGVFAVGARGEGFSP
jgi:hypothetical protein